MNWLAASVAPWCTTTMGTQCPAPHSILFPTISITHLAAELEARFGIKTIQLITIWNKRTDNLIVLRQRFRYRPFTRYGLEQTTQDVIWNQLNSLTQGVNKRSASCFKADNKKLIEPTKKRSRTAQNFDSRLTSRLIERAAALETHALVRIPMLFEEVHPRPRVPLETQGLKKAMPFSHHSFAKLISKCDMPNSRWPVPFRAE
ncbi:hypothetical protein CEXT_541531 [Caerostris extrusa]|uniref:Uncharacterized protein n=1 Tax=Caerostris extrusa TaxID=172846 RepID=A0AAV4UN27_CAEEX|nr:hypothetical protein CEXT_541531 [Caerostris extrusa]